MARLLKSAELALIFAIRGAVNSSKHLAMPGGGTASQKLLKHLNGMRWRPLSEMISGKCVQGQRACSARRACGDPSCCRVGRAVSLRSAPPRACCSAACPRSATDWPQSPDWRWNPSETTWLWQRGAWDDKAYTVPPCIRQSPSPEKTPHFRKIAFPSRSPPAHPEAPSPEPFPSENVVTCTEAND